MPNSEILMSNFKSKYGLEQSFDELQASVSGRASKIRVSEELLAEGSSKSPQAQQYLTGLLHIFEKITEKKIAPEQKGSTYSFSSFDIIHFLRDYEEIMAAKHAEAHPTKHRNPYEGLAVEVLNRVAENIRAYNQPLPDLWAKRIRDKKFNIEDLDRITDNIHNAAYRSLRSEKNHEDREVNFLSKDSKPSVETAIIIHDALEKAIKKRTIFTYLWAGNWRRISKENACMEKLEAQLQDYNRWDREIIANTRLKYTEPTISAHQELLEHRDTIIAEHKQKKKERKLAIEKDQTLKAKTQPKNSKQKVESYDASLDKFEKLLTDDNTTKAMQNDIHQLLHASKMPAGILKHHLPAIYGVAIDQIKGIWSSIRGTSAEEKEYQVKHGAIDLVGTIYNALNTHEMDTKDRLVAAQKIADLMLNKYSPIAFNGDYKEYGNRYFVNNATPTQIKDLTNYEEDIENLIEDVKNEIEREPLIELPKDKQALNKNQEIKDNAKSIEKSSNAISAEEVDARLDDTSLADKLKPQINEMLSKSPLSFNIRKHQISGIQSQIIESIRNIWDNINANPDADKNAIMEQGAKDTFKTTYDIINMCGIESTKDRLVAAQKITDLMMKNYSPAAFDSEYAKYADNYYMKNASDEEIQRLTGYDIISGGEIIEDAKVDLGIAKEHVKFDDTLDSNVSQVSQKIEEHKAPSKDMIINS